jgi:gamma-glutamyltranspeptidase
MRVVQFSDRIVLLAAAFATGGSAFDAAVNTNLAVYWVSREACNVGPSY